jgi:hypothetical protein
VRIVYVAEQFWPWAMAAVPVPVTHWYLREHWGAAVDRADFTDIRVHALREFRSKLLAQAEADAERHLRLTDSDVDLGAETLRDRRSQAEANLLARLLPELALSEDEGRRLLLRRVRD